jgi:hypothetical protein
MKSILLALSVVPLIAACAGACTPADIHDTTTVKVPVYLKPDITMPTHQAYVTVPISGDPDVQAKAMATNDQIKNTYIQSLERILRSIINGTAPTIQVQTATSVSQ